MGLVDVKVDAVVHIHTGLSEEQVMTLKEALEAGKQEIFAVVANETAQHAAKLQELADKIGTPDLTPDELKAELLGVAAKIGSIVPDEVVDPSPTPPAGPGE
jgi:hypothetical protein